jgi:8-oxo-dGTP pyrophosphatase MutT (NUDIX family)
MTTFRCERSIRIAAAVVVDPAGKVLLVRKRGTRAFMQPGGKIAPDETAIEALGREISEELGCAVEGTPRHLGVFSAPAANEPDTKVEAELFAVTLVGEINAAAEIEEALWHDPAGDAGLPLAPLTRVHVLPLVQSGTLR